MTVKLNKATKTELHGVSNLMQLYLYDMAEYTGWACREDGIYSGDEWLDSYWREPGKHAFVLRDDQEWAGFVMVRGNHDENDLDYSVAEFFILRKFRRQGIGQRIAAELFDRFPGRWMVEVFIDNTPAVAFWKQATNSASHRSITLRSDERGDRHVIHFRTK